MDTIDGEIAEIINDALSSGYDVEIKITQRADDQSGRLQLPMAWVNRLADRRISTSDPKPLKPYIVRSTS